MSPQTERLLQQHLRSRRWARLPYRWGVLLILVLLAPLAFGILVGGLAFLLRSIGIH